MYQVNDDLSIYVTRGDIVSLDVKAMQGGSTFIFPAGSSIRIKVFEKKNCENVVLQKDFAVDADSESVPIDLTEYDTRIGGIISKPVDYWYEVELNPFTDPQTIIGYDEDGPKVFRLFPEGRDLTDDIQPEDIPIVDAELDLTSQRPIQNQAVARKFTTVEEEAEDHYQNKKNPHTVTADQLGALKRSGGTMTGDINMSTHRILGLPEAKGDGDALLLGQAKEMFPNFRDFEGKSDTVQRVSGTLIAVKNSAHTPFKGLKLYGKTTQDGTPTLENLVELVSSENPNVMVSGKNILPYPYHEASVSQNGMTISPQEDGGLAVSGTPTGYVDLYLYDGLPIVKSGSITISMQGVFENITLSLAFYDGSGTMLGAVNAIPEGKNHITINLDDYPTSERWLILVKRVNNDQPVSGVVYPQVELGDTPTEYEFRNVQTVGTTNTIRGIPVTEAKNATYTDENGQMWLSDEIDFEKGVYIQRVNKKTLTAEDISYVSTAYFEYGTYVFTTIKDALDTSSDVVVISDKMFGISADQRTGSGYDDKYRCYAQSGVVYLRFPAGTGQKTLEECKAAFTGVTLQYALAEPIETPLSYNEMAAYEALRTYDPNTTVYNDADAYMMVDYFTPTTPMQVNHGERNAGKILGIDEQGNAVPQDGSEKFAPSGYGLGGLSVYASNPDNVTSNGFYYCDENSSGIEDDFKESAFIHMNRSETEMVQIFVNTLGDFGVRRYLAGAWGEIKTATLSGSGAVG